MVLKDNARNERRPEVGGNYSDHERVELQHGEGEESTLFQTNMCLDYLFIITLVSRLHERYGGVCIVSLIEFFDELDFDEISSENLESYIQTLFQNDIIDMERLWRDLRIEAFLPDRERS